MQKANYEESMHLLFLCGNVIYISRTTLCNILSENWTRAVASKVHCPLINEIVAVVLLYMRDKNFSRVSAPEPTKTSCLNKLPFQIYTYIDHAIYI